MYPLWWLQFSQTLKGFVVSHFILSLDRVKETEVGLITVLYLLFKETKHLEILRVYNLKDKTRNDWKKKEINRSSLVGTTRTLRVQVSSLIKSLPHSILVYNYDEVEMKSITMTRWKICRIRCECSRYVTIMFLHDFVNNSSLLLIVLTVHVYLLLKPSQIWLPFVTPRDELPFNFHCCQYNDITIV